MLALIFSLFINVLQLVDVLLLVYCIMTFVIPNSRIVQVLGQFFSPILSSIRTVLFRIFPSLRNSMIDISPMILWFLCSVAIWVIQMLWRLFV